MGNNRNGFEKDGQVRIMTQQPVFLHQYVEHSHMEARAHGFWDDLDGMAPEHYALIKAALIDTEVAEFVEAMRHGDPPAEHIDSKQFTLGEEELADACIRIFDLAGKLGYDLEAAIDAKMAFNKERPYKHEKRV